MITLSVPAKNVCYPESGKTTADFIAWMKENVGRRNVDWYHVGWHTTKVLSCMLIQVPDHDKAMMIKLMWCQQ